MKRLKIESFPNREIRLTLTDCRAAKKFSYSDQVEEDEEPRPDLYLSLVQNSRTPTNTESQREESVSLKPGFGGLPKERKFSVYGRRQILRAGGALERKVSFKDCLFLTLTHPGSTEESFEALARFSGRAVKLLHDWLSNHVQSKLSLYVWEWQKRGALHLHYVVNVPDKERGEWIRQNLQAQWVRILDTISRESGVDLFRKNRGFSWASDKSVVRVDAQWCVKSVAAYLSKYVSKCDSKGSAGLKRKYCPSRWYGISRPLLALVREYSMSVLIDNLRFRDAWSYYEDCLSLLKSFALKCYEYLHKLGSGKSLVAYCETNEQESLWSDLMDKVITSQPYSSSTERNLRRLVRNGIILLRKHKRWFSVYMQFNGQSRGVSLLNSPSLKDISRADLMYLVDALTYSFRYVQKTQAELPGECKLWYSQVRDCIEFAPPDDSAWIGPILL